MVARRTGDALAVSVGADISNLASGMRTARQLSTGSMEAIRREAALTERALAGVGRSFGRGISPYSIVAASRGFERMSERVNLLRASLLSTTTVFGGFAAALSTNVVLRYADSFTQLQNQIRPLAKDSADLEARFAGVSDVADRSRAGLRDTATLYARIGKALPGLGNEKTLRIVETIQKSLQLGGATTQEAASAAIQFSQALASGRLGGEELRAVIETPLGGALAQGLGVTIGQFREMSKAGLLTAEVLIGALDKMASSVDDQFAKSLRTLDQDLTVADNKLTEYIGTLNNATGATLTIGNGILALANNLETLVPLLAAAGLLAGNLFAGRALGAGAARLSARVGEAASSAKSIVSGRRAQEALKATREKFQADLDAFRAASAERSRLRRLSPEQVRSKFANPDTADALAGRQDAIAKAAERRLKLTKELQEAERQLDATKAVAGPRAVAIANQVAASEQKVVNLQKEKRQIERALAKVPQVQTEAARRGLASSKVVQDYNQKAIEARTRLASVERSLARETESLATRRKALLDSETATVRRAADERIKAIQKVNAIQERITPLNTSIARDTFRSRGLVQQADTTATRNYAGAVAESDRVTKALATTLATSRASIEIATKATTGLGRAMGTLRAAGAGLTAFLGGPWGVAFAGVILLLEGMAISSSLAARNQEELRRAMAATGTAAEDSADQIESLDKKIQDLRAEELRSRKNLFEERLRQQEQGRSFLESQPGFIPGGGAAEGLADIVRDMEQMTDEGNRLMAMIVGLRAATNDFERLKSLTAIAESFRKGEIEVADVKERLDEISEQNISEPVDEFIKRLRVAIKETAELRSDLKVVNDEITVRKGYSNTEENIFRQIDRRSTAGLEESQRNARITLEQIGATQGLTEQERELETAVEELTKVLTDKGLIGALGPQEIRDAAQRGIDAKLTGSGLDKALQLLRGREGFIEQAAPDYTFRQGRKVNGAYRAGYGSDTLTDESGNVSRVTSATRTTREAAERDLLRRAKEYQVQIIDKIGAETFKALGDNAQAALTSLTYNYGRLPDDIAAAARTGDRTKLARAIRARENDNSGINKVRRNIEADLVVTDSPESREALQEDRKGEEEAKRKAEKLAEEADERKKRFAEEIADSQKRVAQLQLETDALGKSAYAKAYAEEKQRLLNAAKKEEQELTPALLASIEKEAEAVGRAAQVKAAAEFEQGDLKRAKQKVEDLEAEAEAYGKTAAQVESLKLKKELLRKLDEEGGASADQVAQIDAVTEALRRQTQATEDAQKRASNAAEINSTFKDATKGLISDLIAGKSAAEAFSNALGKIADKLLDLALNSIFDNLGIFGNSAGGGGIGDVLAGLFDTGGIVGKGSRRSARVSPAAFLGAPQFAKGGMVGGGRPIIAHDGELILNRVQQRAVLGQMNQQPVVNKISIINEHGSAKVQTRQSSDGRSMEFFIKETAVRGVTSERARRQMGSAYAGLSRPVIQR